MKLTAFDQHDLASQLAAEATVRIAAWQPQILPARVEDLIEELLAPAFEQVLGRLEFTRDGDVSLKDEEPAAVRTLRLVSH